MATAARRMAAQPTPTPRPIMAGVDKPLDEESSSSSTREGVVAGPAAPSVGLMKSVLVEVIVSVVGRRLVMTTVEVTDTVSRAPTTLWLC